MKMMLTRRGATPAALLAAALIAGCGKLDQITRYEAPKRADVTQAALRDAPDGMLAAILLKGDSAWFFKLSGPNEAVAAEEENFRRLLKSVTFPDGDGGPEWELPEGWTQEAGGGLRFATLKLEAKGEELEVSVTQLPGPGEGASLPDRDGFILENVNRWRGQLGLPPIEPVVLARETESIKTPAGAATLVAIQGKLAAGGGPPFAGGAAAAPPIGPEPPIGPALPPDHPPAAGGVERPGTAPLTFDTPEGWAASAGSSLSVAAFRVKRDGGQIEVTVTPLAAAAGEMLPNVNRWRGQLGLPATTAENLKKEAEPIKVDGSEGTYVEALQAPGGDSPRGLLGVIVVHGDSAWFFKLIGDRALALEERDHFKSFVRSVKFK